MLFDIKELDEPLHVTDDCICKLCKKANSISPNCTYCNTIKRIVDDLTVMKLRIFTINLGSIKHEPSARKNRLAIVSSILHGAS